MKTTFVLATCFWLLLLAAQVSAQGHAYVTDELEITLRTGKTNQHSIVRMLPSGARVEVLERDEEGYTRIRTSNGAEGWVLTRYLENQPVAKDRLKAATDRAAKLEEENQQLKQKLASVSQEQKSLELNQGSLAEENRKLSQELARIRQTAANALNLESENELLKKRLFTLERESQVLMQQTDALKNRRDRDWFLAGAGVLLFGMIVGLIVPKLRLRKKSSWDSL